MSQNEHPGTAINGSAAGTAINTSTVLYTRLELSYYPAFFCKNLDLWLMSPLLSNVVLCFSTVV